MTIPKYLISSFLLVLSASLLLSVEGRAQCASTVNVESLKNSSDPSVKDASISFKVQTAGAYECHLYSYVNATKKLVQTKRGTGNEIIKFSDLDNKPFYKVDFTFLTENDPFCQTRVIDPIDLTGKRK